jgi:hypothetical protein
VPRAWSSPPRSARRREVPHRQRIGSAREHVHGPLSGDGERPATHGDAYPVDPPTTAVVQKSRTAQFWAVPFGPSVQRLGRKPRSRAGRPRRGSQSHAAFQPARKGPTPPRTRRGALAVEPPRRDGRREGRPWFTRTGRRERAAAARRAERLHQAGGFSIITALSARSAASRTSNAIGRNRNDDPVDAGPGSASWCHDSPDDHRARRGLRAASPARPARIRRSSRRGPSVDLLARPTSPTRGTRPPGSRATPQPESTTDDRPQDADPVPPPDLLPSS